MSKRKPDEQEAAQEPYALDRALQLLAGASNALERAQPSLKDVEEARDSAKAAHKLLDASYQLLVAGVHRVCPIPLGERQTAPDPGPPLPFPEHEETPVPAFMPPPPNMDRETGALIDELPWTGATGGVIDADIVATGEGETEEESGTAPPPLEFINPDGSAVDLTEKDQAINEAKLKTPYGLMLDTFDELAHEGGQALVDLVKVREKWWTEFFTDAREAFILLKWVMDGAGPYTDPTTAQTARMKWVMEG
ncbi:MAG TPA: hypothetical protein VFF76_00870 [Holophagaceae bacterium]|jgi:hypothetical protein|nr:hypothetical protein [Holophagaceae bacterium]